MKKISGNDTQALYEAILNLKTLEESKRFFRDLLTQTEIEELSERWKIARLLASKAPYIQIIKETGMSSTTVARVARWLKKGKGGYRIVLKRMGLMAYIIYLFYPIY